MPAPDTLLLLLMFVFSGAAGLIYEVLWFRDFSYILGGSVHTLAVVLAAYMAGLAVGSRAAAGRAVAAQAPLAAYGWLELGVGLAAAAVYLLFRAGLRSWGAIAAWSPAEAGGLAARFVVSFLVLAVPTSLMGATLPFLAEHATRTGRRTGAAVGTLYAANALGAAGGSLLAAFVLVRTLGMAGATAVAVATNAAIGLGALVLARVRRVPPAAPASAASAKRGRFPPYLLAALAGSGFAAFAYELVFFRFLCYALGNRVFASATMLAAFLTALAAGGWTGGRLADRTDREPGWFAWCQITIGAWAIAVGASFPAWLDAFAAWEARLAPTSVWAVAGIRYLFALGVLGPLAFASGATLPLVVRALARAGDSAGTAAGRAVAWNTAGGIAGSLLAGFVMIPRWGSYRTLVITGVVSLLLGHRVLAPRWRTAPWWRRVASAGAVGGLSALLAVAALEWDPYPWPRPGLTRVFAHEDATALVTVYAGPLGWYLFGDDTPLSFPLGRLTAAAQVQRFQAWLPLLVHPAPRRVLVIGLGFGVTSGAFATSERVERVETVELAGGAIRAASVYAADNEDVLRLPRSAVLEGDGREHLRRSGPGWDVITSNVTGPDLPGSASCYTRDYFELARRRLNPGGIFTLHAYGPHAPVILATLADVFPHLQAFRAYRHTVFYLASERPVAIDVSTVDAVLATSPAVRRGARRAGIRSGRDLLAKRLADNNGLRDVVRRANQEVNRDDRPLLEFDLKPGDRRLFLSRW